MRLIDVPMVENDVNAETVGEFLKALLLTLWKEADGFSGKRPFGNSDWQYQVYASLIEAGYEIGTLDEDGYVDDVDYVKADKLVMDAISEVFAADAEPVVRCKDCKHWDCYYYCDCHSADENGTPIFMREYDFCSYGERREKDG